MTLISYWLFLNSTLRPSNSQFCPPCLENWILLKGGGWRLAWALFIRPLFALNFYRVGMEADNNDNKYIVCKHKSLVRDGWEGDPKRTINAFTFQVFLAALAALYLPQ